MRGEIFDFRVNPNVANRNWRDIDICVFDLETTSKDPAEARVVQFAGQIYRQVNNEPYLVDQYEVMVNPEIPIPEDASGVHGFYDCDVELADTFADAVDGMLDFMANANALCGYNAVGYDCIVMRNELARAGIDNMFLYPTIDVMLLFFMMKKRLRISKRKNRLEDVGRFYGVATSAAAMHGEASYHDATVDVAATAEILYKMGYEHLDAWSLDQLLTQQEDYFWKHRA